MIVIKDQAKALRLAVFGTEKRLIFDFLTFVTWYSSFIGHLFVFVSKYVPKLPLVNTPTKNSNSFFGKVFTSLLIQKQRHFAVWFSLISPSPLAPRGRT
jgi:hypothetical protein